MRRKKSWSLWGMVLIAGVMLMTDVNPVQAAAPAGTLKEAIHWGLSADWLDPATNSALLPSQIVLYLFHDALFKPMPDGTYSPCLAESWTVSPDAKVYEFKLRKGVKFHNGDTMTAEDVIFSFWRFKATQAKIIHDKTEKVEAVNPYLVRFKFKESFPDFLEAMLPGSTTIGWVVPKKYVEKVGEAGFKKAPVGAGPYKFVEFVAGQKLVAEAFEGFWRKVPPIKRLEFHIVTEPATRLAMVERGEVDIATLMQGVFYENVKKNPKLRLLAPLSPTRWVVYLTTQWDPKSPWSNPKVRKAASLAIDRQTLADIYMPGCGPIGSLALPGDPMGVDYPADPYDPAQAKKLLAEAGYPKGFNGGTFYPYEGGYWPYGEQVANYWKAIGITLDTVLLDRPAWYATRQARKMAGGTFIDNIQAASIGGRLLYLFGSTGYGNYPDIQELWDKYQKEASFKVRKELVGHIQKLIHDKTMFLMLTSTNSPAAVGPRVKGNPWGIQPLVWFTAPFEDMELVKE
jgi:peptide/nickel transport system substrate-binding protein